MVITYHGENYFKIQSGSFTVLVDPTDSRSFRGANLILSTLKPSAVPPPDPEGAPSGSGAFFVDHQGEYEVKDAAVRGISAGGERALEKTIYRIVLEGIDLLVLGHLSKEPSPEIQESFKGAQVVIVPVGKPFISEEVAAKLMRQIEPALVIPSLSNPAAAGLKGFLRELGKEKCPTEEKLVFKAKDLEPGKLEVKCLK
ncbi:MAG: MBL fold metallo-hydrolase [Candidatus Brennerbacteria bacterium]|nr:MBL fold metallo-hydrolase [Candidatus Brennerbacteria bacterium]